MNKKILSPKKTSPFIRWIFIGLFIRLLLMPFAFHGSDIFFIYYSPFKFITEGAFDPYLYLHEHFPYFPLSYYLPGLYFYFCLFLQFLKIFLPKLDVLFSIFSAHFYNYQFNTVHYAALFNDVNIFRTLFLFKLPYLLADYGVGFILIWLLKKNSQRSLLAFKIWMLNPFVLHSCYMIGQLDIVTALFVMIAVFYIVKNNFYVAMIFLSLGALTKVYPGLLIPPAIFLLGNNLRERIKLLLICLACSVIIILPFYITSGLMMLKIYGSYAEIPPIRRIVLFLGYFFLLLTLLFRKNKEKNIDYIISIFSIILLWFFVAYSVTLRMFVPLTPFLIYLAVKKGKRFWIYNLIIFISLFWLRTPATTQQWGLFASLYPEFFSSLPIADSFINLVFDVHLLHKILYRIFLLTGICMIIDLLFGLRKNSIKSPIFAQNA